MKLVAIACSAFSLSVAACVSPPATEPRLQFDPGPWFVGEPQTMQIEWPQEVTCNSNGFDCDTGPIVEFQIDKVTCTGCTTSGVELGKTVGNADNFQFVPDTTDGMTVEVQLSSGGEQRTLTANALGDRELGLVADCEIVYTSDLGDSELPTQPCGATRTADQSVVVGWYIATFRGQERVPFCPDDAIYCGPDYPRKTSSIQMSPAPQMWWAGTVPVYTSISAPSIAMTVPLSDGTPSSAQIDVPPVQ